MLQARLFEIGIPGINVLFLAVAVGAALRVLAIAGIVCSLALNDGRCYCRLI